MKTEKINNQGFTLIEILVGLVISVVLLMAIGVSFESQTKSQITQQQVDEMQQNVRAAMYILSEEIRLAGFDTSLDKEAEAGFVTAGPSRIRFTLDVRGDGDGCSDFTDVDADGNSIDISDGEANDSCEDITFGFSDEDDADGNGIADAGFAMLRRETCTDSDGDGDNDECSTLLPMADTIEAIRFVYGYDTDDDGVVDGWDVDADNDGDLDVSGAGLDEIIAVRVTLLARTKNLIRDFEDVSTYDLDGPDADVDIDGDGNGDGIYDPPDQTYRRRMLTTVIRCRNMGLSG